MNSFVSSDDAIKSPRVPFLIDISAEATLINEPRKVSECVKLILSVLSHLKCKCKLAVSHSCLLLDFHWHLLWCQFSTNITISLSPSPSSSSLWICVVCSFKLQLPLRWFRWDGAYFTCRGYFLVFLGVFRCKIKEPNFVSKEWQLSHINVPAVLTAVSLELCLP